MQIEVPGAEHVDNTVTIDGASMLPSSMQGVGYEPEGGGPMQVSGDFASVALFDVRIGKMRDTGVWTRQFPTYRTACMGQCQK